MTLNPCVLFLDMTVFFNSSIAHTFEADHGVTFSAVKVVKIASRNTWATIPRE